MTISQSPLGYWPEHWNLAEEFDSSPELAGPVSQFEPAFWPESQQPQPTDTVSLPLPELNSLFCLPLIRSFY